MGKPRLEYYKGIRLNTITEYYPELSITYSDVKIRGYEYRQYKAYVTSTGDVVADDTEEVLNLKTLLEYINHYYSKCVVYKITSEEEDDNTEKKDDSLTVDRVDYHTHNNTTIVFFKDGSKSIVKAIKFHPTDLYDGVAIAIAKKTVGTNSELKRIVNNVRIVSKKRRKK